MMHIVNIHQAKTHLSRLIAKVLSGEEIIIGKSGKPIAKLIPYNTSPTKRKLGGDWEGKVWISDDFDDLPQDFMQHFEGKE